MDVKDRYFFCFCAELGVGASVFHVHCHALVGSSRPAQQLGLQALLRPDLPLPVLISWPGKCLSLQSEASFSLRRQARQWEGHRLPSVLTGFSPSPSFPTACPAKSEPQHHTHQLL